MTDEVGAGISEETIKTRKLREELWNLLENSSNRENVDSERKEKQKRIIDSLPDDFWLNFKGELILETWKIGDQLYPSREGKGLLFEELVRADTDVGGEETNFALTLRQFMSHPKRFSHLCRKDLFGKTLSNPDLVKINENGEITGWVECKSGRISRTVQFENKGFVNSFNVLLQNLKSIPDEVFEKFGLSCFAGEGKDKLRLADSLALHLAIPWGSNPEGIEDVEKMGYKIYRSPFSHGEIIKIMSFLVGKYRSEIVYDNQKLARIRQGNKLSGKK